MTTREDNGQFSAKYNLNSEYTKLYDDYGEFVTINTDKKTTEERLRAGVRAWLYWCQEKNLHPFDVVERDVRRYIKSMQKEAKEETTITRRISSVSKYYHFLRTDPDVEVDVEENPTSKIRLRRDYDITNSAGYVHVLTQEDRDDIIAVDYEDIEPIFDHVPGKRTVTRVRNELICRLMYQTAVRSDEASRFRLKRVDWDNREILVRSAKLNLKDHPLLYKRRVWWEPSIDVLMKRWEQKRSEFDPDEECPYLFCTENGTQMSPGHISRIVKDAAHNAGVNEPLTRDAEGNVKQWLFTAHRLRHSRITHLANDPINMDLNALRMMAGHVSFDTTLTYVHPDWDTARNAFVEALSK